MESLKKLIERPIQGPYDVHEMEFVVAEYIRARKGVTVYINICKGISIPMNEVSQHLYIRQVKLLTDAFSKAWAWFRENPDKT